MRFPFILPEKNHYLALVGSSKNSLRPRLNPNANRVGEEFRHHWWRPHAREGYLRMPAIRSVGGLQHHPVETFGTDPLEKLAGRPAHPNQMGNLSTSYSFGIGLNANTNRRTTKKFITTTPATATALPNSGVSPTTTRTCRALNWATRATR